MNRILKVILVRAHKAKQRTVDEASVFLTKTYIILSKLLVDIKMVKAIPKRSQKEKRNKLLNNGERATLLPSSKETG